VSIDYRAATKPEALADDAKRLEDEGLLQHEIAEALGVTSKMTGMALDAWYEGHGETRLDGRVRRTLLGRKQAGPPRYKQIADEVQRLRTSGLEAKEVALRLNCDRNMEYKAWLYWHRSRGVIPPNARPRRSHSLRVNLACVANRPGPSAFTSRATRGRLDVPVNHQVRPLVGTTWYQEICED
jgi:hypothetical protein